MSNSYDVIVVGGGITGASALYYLAQNKNLKVLLLEKNSQLGQGASGLWGFLTRVFHSNIEVMQLAYDYFDFHCNFKKHFGGDNHYTKTGSLYFLKKHDLEFFAPHIELLRQNGVDFELLEAKEGKKRFPNFCWYEDDVVIYEPQAGLTGLSSSVKYLASWSCQNSPCEVRLNTALKEVIYKGDQVQGVKLESGETLRAKIVVLCLGSWGFRFLEDIGEVTPFFPKVIQLNKFNRYRKDIEHPFFVDFCHNTFGHLLPTGSFIGGYLSNQNITEDIVPGKVNGIEANEAKYQIGKRITWIKNAALEDGICAIESYCKRGFGHVLWSSKIKNLLYTGGFSCTGYMLFPMIGREIADKIEEVC